MGSGRKKSNVKTPKVEAPPTITNFNFTSPTGDQFTAKRSGNSQNITSQLSPLSQSTVSTSMAAMDDLARELWTPDPSRTQAIADRARDFYNIQAQSINDEADNVLSKASSDISKRFGGTYNSTFGADYLAKVQASRLDALSNASAQARLYGEDLYTNDETSRMARFNAFQSFLMDKYNQAAGVANLGTNTLQNEAGRAQNLAITKANMAMEAARANQLAQLQREQMRTDLIKAYIGASQDTAKTLATAGMG